MILFEFVPFPEEKCFTPAFHLIENFLSHREISPNINHGIFEICAEFFFALHPELAAKSCEQEIREKHINRNFHIIILTFPSLLRHCLWIQEEDDRGFEYSVMGKQMCKWSAELCTYPSSSYFQIPIWRRHVNAFNGSALHQSEHRSESSYSQPHISLWWILSSFPEEQTADGNMEIAGTNQITFCSQFTYFRLPFG